MVDEREFLKQYTYKATSNLVLEQNRASRRERVTGSGEVAPLKTDELPGRMGDMAGLRSEKVSPSGDQGRGQRGPPGPRRTEFDTHQTPMGKAPVLGAASTGVRDTKVVADLNVVDVANELELNEGHGGYAPTTLPSQRAYEALLGFIVSKLGDKPRDLLHSAADEVLAVLKAEQLSETDRKKNVAEILLSSISREEFSQLSDLGRRISDFQDPNAPTRHTRSDTIRGNQLHDGEEVALLFEEDGNEENGTATNALDEVLDLREPSDTEAPVFESLDVAPSTGRSLPDGEFKPEFQSLQQPTFTAQHVFEGMDALHIRDVHGYWVQRQLKTYYRDPHQCQQVAEEVLSIISQNEDNRTCENRLGLLLEFDKFELISALLKHREVIVYGTRLSRASTDAERQAIESEMAQTGSGRKLLSDLRKEDVTTEQASDVVANAAHPVGVPRLDSGSCREPEVNRSRKKRKRASFPLRKLDLDSLSFQKGGRVVTVRDVKLPAGSAHVEKKEYEEWHIPAVSAVADGKEQPLVPLTALPDWGRLAFPNVRTFNRVQSSVFSCAFDSDENMLLCAPTGAGKTNVAVLTILRTIRNSFQPGSEMKDIKAADFKLFKIVYVAPMKALVAEVVDNLGRRLADLGISVKELTGDVNLSKHDIDQTQIIVTTPEKWDILTRKSSQRSFTSLVRLLIVDEVHLLHDERGPVLEAIVARTLSGIEALTKTTRVVALSATLPNYRDVAAFLRVKPEKGLFHFDLSHRPCALQQCYVGISAKKPLKRFHVMNEITYEKVKQQLQSSNQVIIFVHSRKETSATSQYLVDKAIDDETTHLLMKPGESLEVIRSELPNLDARDLGDLLEQGLATHHAGMSRSDRHLVEALFEGGHIRVLVSTATLAWGVNLPAHAVIIKGTQVYAPEFGRWIELSPMDVMQMMGRAGRPQFDTYGEGYIITSKGEIQYYLSLLTHQLPIESRMISRIVDMLNAEVAIGSVSSVQEGSTWLSHTYLYVRMLSNPSLYGVSVDERNTDPTLERRRAELVHTAASQLHQSGLVTYNPKTADITPKELGRVAADFYVSHETMSLYMRHLKPSTTDVDLLRVFSMSGEFRHMRVREEEKLELSRLAERVPIPVKESLDEPSAKVNVLFQAFVSNLSLDGLALKADMVHVTQSAARLMRALLQVAVQMKRAALVERCLSLSKVVATRQWPSQTPLRQFRDALSRPLLHRVERKDISFERYYDLSVSELGELLRDPKLGRAVHRLVHSIPRLELDAHVRPLTRSMLEIDLTLSPDFRFDERIHGKGERFWIFVEDSDSEVLLHTELFFLQRSLATEDHFLKFTVQLSTPTPPQYFIKCISDAWIGPESILPISFRGLLLPEKFAPHTKPLDLHPLSVANAFPLKELEGDSVDGTAHNETMKAVRSYFATTFSHFNSLQTQMFQSLFNSGANALVATLPNMDRLVCAELCIARLFCRNPAAIAVWVVGRGSVAVDGTQRLLETGIGRHLNLKVVSFLSDRGADLNLLRSSGTIAVTTSERWDMFSRKWRQKREGKIIRNIDLIVIDGLHMISEWKDSGAALEVVCSRMRYIAADMTERGKEPFRIVCLSDPIANAKELGYWMGAPPSAVFSFHPKELEHGIRVESTAVSPRSGTRASYVAAVSQAIASEIGTRCSGRSVLVYVPSRKLARSVALEVLDAAAQHGNPKILLHASGLRDADVGGISTNALRECIQLGIGYIHQGMNRGDMRIVEGLFQTLAIRVLVATSDYAWESNLSRSCRIIIAGTQLDISREVALRHDEYPMTDLLKMMCSVKNESSPDQNPTLIITSTSRLDFYRLRSVEPMPVESQLQPCLADHLNAEISAGVVETKQEAVDYLTWTFIYKRLPKNPNYYGMSTRSLIGISNHLSEVVETALSDLEASKCVAAEGEEDVTLGALNLGIIASHYYIRHSTVELFASSVTPKTRLRGLLDILSLASEFSMVNIRADDAEALRSLSRNLPLRPPSKDSFSLSSPHSKTHLLLQAQLSRHVLSPELTRDQSLILPVAMRLLRAMVDIISSAGWLKPAIAAVELTQLLTQGLWDTDPPLMQLPHIDRVLASELRDVHNVSDVFSFLDMDPTTRSGVLQNLSNKEVSEIATACQQFPSLDDIQIQSVDLARGDGNEIIVKVTVGIRRNDEAENGSGSDDAKRVSSTPVMAPLYPDRRDEGWWVVIGDVRTNSVLTLKHLILKQEAVIKLEFSPLAPGKQTYQLYLLSDSYFVDCDLEEEFELNVPSSDAGHLNNALAKGELDVEPPSAS